MKLPSHLLLVVVALDKIKHRLDRIKKTLDRIKRRSERIKALLKLPPNLEGTEIEVRSLGYDLDILILVCGFHSCDNMYIVFWKLNDRREKVSEL
jgi:hypothetical protein